MSDDKTELMISVEEEEMISPDEQHATNLHSRSSSESYDKVTQSTHFVEGHPSYILLTQQEDADEKETFGLGHIDPRLKNYPIPLVAQTVDLQDDDMSVWSSLPNG